MNSKSTFSIFSSRDMALIGMFAACMAVISQISVPMPTGVPLTVQIFGVALLGRVLGWKRGFCSICIYLLIGAVGLPVFANFSGGASRFVSFSGGYLWSWPFMAALCGVRPKTGQPRRDWMLTLLCAFIGLALCETIGAFQWALLAGDKTFPAIMAYALVAFIPKDIVLMLLGILTGNEICRRIRI